MARYIDADAALNKLPDDLPYKASVKRVLMSAPAAEVVEAVRCKDCKHCFINKFGEESSVGICNKRGVIGTIVQLDDFCSYGERRTDNDL